jgi:hypothetical protein
LVQTNAAGEQLTVDDVVVATGHATKMGRGSGSWRGGRVHRLQISVFSIAGDDHTTWATTFDF